MRLRVVKRIVHPRQPEPSEVWLLGIANSGVCTHVLKFAAHKGIRFARSARTAAVPACCTECETVRIGLPLMPSAVRRPSWLSCGGLGL